MVDNTLFGLLVGLPDRFWRYTVYGERLAEFDGFSVSVAKSGADRKTKANEAHFVRKIEFDTHRNGKKCEWHTQL